MSSAASTAEVRIGQEAPDFTLRDENGQEVHLKDLRGTPVVLVFFPFAFSRTCTAELCAYRDDYSRFQAKGARVFGISRDSIYAQKAFKEKEGLTYSLLSDMKGEVARQYGAWNEEAAVAERMTVVIDKNGIVRYVIHNDIKTPRDDKEALAAIS